MDQFGEAGLGYTWLLTPAQGAYTKRTRQEGLDVSPTLNKGTSGTDSSTEAADALSTYVYLAAEDSTQGPFGSSLQLAGALEFLDRGPQLV